MTQDAGHAAPGGEPENLVELRRMMHAAEIDTLIVAFTDMQGRLMGKRVQAQAFLDGISQRPGRQALRDEPDHALVHGRHDEARPRAARSSSP